jgi:hypothetical protein
MKQMQVEVICVDKYEKGWNAKVKVILTPEELSHLNKDSISLIEDFDVNLENSVLYFNCFFDKSEPWEDEYLEEILKAIKLEVEYKTRKLLENY